MSRDDIQKLLGGYATGTLTPEEQRALFEAALTDQELFDSLVREEALREVLSDPAARGRLLAAMDEAPAPWYRQWWRPILVMATAVLMVAGIAVWERSRTPKPLPMAKVELPPLPRPIETQNAPILPPPPKVKTAAPPLAPLALPAATPAAAPPPQASPAPARDGAFVIDGSVSPPPMRQMLPAQTQQAQPQAQFAPAARSPFARQTSVPLHGKVTDASGEGISSASVAVKSLATGDVVTTSTDAKGEFNAPEAPGGTYQISATAPGFRSATVSQVTPLYGAPEPVNLKLDVGATADSVQVTAGAAPVRMEPRAAAGSGGRGIPRTGLASVEDLKKVPLSSPFEYHLLRRTASGELMEVRANDTVPPGATLILRIVPATDGYLRIVESARVIANPPVRQGVPSEIALPQSDSPGRVELQVYFSPQAVTESKEQPPAVTIAFNIR